MATPNLISTQPNCPTYIKEHKHRDILANSGTNKDKSASSLIQTIIQSYLPSQNIPQETCGPKEFKSDQVLFIEIHFLLESASKLEEYLQKCETQRESKGPISVKFVGRGRFGLEVGETLFTAQEIHRGLYEDSENKDVNCYISFPSVG